MKKVYYDKYMKYKIKYMNTKKNLVGGQKFIMFDKDQRREIMKNYNDIINSKKQCKTFPLKKVEKAAKGMFIYPRIKDFSKEEMCDSIKTSKKRKEGSNSS